jgi:hypothetical protein
MLMKEYPGVVWSCFATNTRTVAPSWDVIDEIDGNPLSQEDSQYHVSVNHTVLCENVENIVARKMVRFLYLPDTRISMDSLFYELTI